MLMQKLKNKLQKIFWAYVTNNFVISGMNDFKAIEPRIECKFMPITLDNYHRVGEFREKNRISQYKDKVSRDEIGCFAEYNGKMIGSIWATVNGADAPRVVRTYMKLMPGEGLIHDIVTGETYRGMGVGPFMVSRMAPLLLQEYGLRRIIIDVSVRNRSSLRMMAKLGLRFDCRMLYVSALSRSVLQMKLKKTAENRPGREV